MCPPAPSVALVMTRLKACMRRLDVQQEQDYDMEEYEDGLDALQAVADAIAQDSGCGLDYWRGFWLLWSPGWGPGWGSGWLVPGWGSSWGSGSYGRLGGVLAVLVPSLGFWLQLSLEGVLAGVLAILVPLLGSWLLWSPLFLGF